MNGKSLYSIFIVGLCLPVFLCGQSNDMFIFIGPDLIVDSNLELPNSIDATQGNILKDGSRFIHNTGLANTFVGYDSGSFEITGMGNTGLGTDSLLNAANGMGNTGLGFSTLVENTDGNGNTVAGVMALAHNQTGNLNTGCGAFALFNNNGSNNTALGAYAGSDVIDGINNVYIAHAGMPNENGIIRIGDSSIHTHVFMQGIFNSVAQQLGGLVEIDTKGKMSCVSTSLKLLKAITSLEGTASILSQAQPLSFSYDDHDGAQRYYGLAAEDVANYCPELVVRDENDEPYAVRYDLLSVVLLHELQMQQALIQSLMDRVAALENQ